MWTLWEPGSMTNQEMLASMLTVASHGKEVLHGQALGGKPIFFIVGDEPSQRDFLIGRPFSGPLGPVLSSAMMTLEKAYAATPDDCYLTYVVKSIFKPGELTEDMVMKEWVPAIQLEYALSGCSKLVAVGKMARALAPQLTVKPVLLETPHRPVLERAKQAWKILLNGVA